MTHRHQGPGTIVGGGTSLIYVCFNEVILEEIKGNQEKLNQLLESLNNGSSFEEMTKFSR
ncbi:hypothetical protein N9Y89_00625 [bacterium]|nr:hypothetical protein [bacterium]